MSKEETKNSGNKASSSSENKVLSSDENKQASSSANKMASASANKIASASENKVASASEKKVASPCERKVASADENKVSALSGNKMPSSSENKAAFTNNNDKNLLKNKEEEKQKLRELLKEMKNSLPKRPKSAIVTSYPGNSPEKMSVQRPAQVNGPKIVDVNVSTKIEPINVKSESNIGINPLYKPKVENISSDIKTQHVEKLDKVIKKSSNKTDSSAQTNDCKESRSVNSTQPALTENVYANVGDKIVIATKKTNADGLVNQNITDLKDPKVLLRKLEMAISKGDDIAAATIARQLAILKINCTVLSSTVTESNTNNSANVEVYIEDQDSHHGPIQLSIGKEMNIAELKQSIAKELNIPINIQRWIIGKQLAVDETEPVKQYNKNDFSQPMFLYLVSPAKDDAKTVCTKQIDNPETIVEPRKVLTKQELKKESPIKDTSVPSSSKVTGNSSKDVVNNSQKILAKKGADHYLELLNLDSQDLIKNMVTFECAICFQDCKAGDGVVLRECLHSFCKECLANTIRYSEEVEIQCPFRDYSYTCESVMQEREIKALVPKDAFEQHLAKSVTVAENSMQKTFHCKSADCKGWCIYEDNVNYFRCPVCRKTNCLTCQAIHEGENCKQYQERIKQNSETDLETLDGQRTKQMLEEMVNKGDAMVCPSCQVVLMKKWGCDWLRCSMCKTEICWVTRGPRWGPAGKGDTTGGCQCGVNGVKCHPKCNYCH